VNPIGVATRDGPTDATLSDDATTPEVAVTTTLSTPALTATDRCDRCQAQAYVRVVLPGGSDLLFCGHHWGRHGEALRPQAEHIHDETHRLAEAPSPDER